LWHHALYQGLALIFYIASDLAVAAAPRGAGGRPGRRPVETEEAAEAK